MHYLILNFAFGRLPFNGNLLTKTELGMVALSLLYMTILQVFAFREFPEGMDRCALCLLITY